MTLHWNIGLKIGNKRWKKRSRTSFPALPLSLILYFVSERLVQFGVCVQVHIKLVKEVLLALLKLPMWQKRLLNTAFNVGKQHGYIGVSLYAFGPVPLTNSIEDVIGTERAYDFFHWLGSKSIGVWRLSHHYEEKYNSGSLKQKLRDFNADMAITYLLYQDNAPSYEVGVEMPRGLQGVLEHFKQVYCNPPIYIQENGMGMPHNSSLEDMPRVEYLHAYIGGVLDAVRNGSDVRGYFTRSFLDVFELLDGNESRYGLYNVDLDDPDLKRFPKLSAHRYSQFLKGRSINSNRTEKKISSSSHGRSVQ
ncbi:hypothetical protein QYF36_011165 [Acer negundo]|nr:hypothetical protein QYF36_011165 [Acer negundo]